MAFFKSCSFNSTRALSCLSVHWNEVSFFKSSLIGAIMIEKRCIWRRKYEKNPIIAFISFPLRAGGCHEFCESVTRRLKCPVRKIWSLTWLLMRQRSVILTGWYGAWWCVISQIFAWEIQCDLRSSYARSIRHLYNMRDWTAIHGGTRREFVATMPMVMIWGLDLRDRIAHVSFSYYRPSCHGIRSPDWPDETNY